MAIPVDPTIVADQVRDQVAEVSLVCNRIRNYHRGAYLEAEFRVFSAAGAVGTRLVRIEFQNSVLVDTRLVEALRNIVDRGQQYRSADDKKPFNIPLFGKRVSTPPGVGNPISFLRTSSTISHFHRVVAADEIPPILQFTAQLLGLGDQHIKPDWGWDITVYVLAMVSSIAFKLIDLQPQSTESDPGAGLDVRVQGNLAFH